MTTFITILFIIVLLGATLAALTLYVWMIKVLKENIGHKKILYSSLIILVFLISVPIILGTLGCMTFQIVAWGC